MVTNGAFSGSTSWTLGGTGMSYSTAQNHVGTAGTGSLLETITGKNKSVTGTAVQSVTITAGSTITAKTDIVAWAMESWTGASGATRTVTIDLRYSDATTVNIFSGTVAANSAWTNLTNNTATVFPLTLAKNVNQITVTVVTTTGNNATAVSSLYTDDISITYTPAVIDSLTVTSNTAVATTAIPGTANIQMQYLQLNSDASGNGNCVLTSATVDDVNIATTGTISNLKVHIDSDTNFTNGVLGTATVAAWDGQSVVVDLTAIAAANRTVTSGTPRYLWITYDIDALAVNGTTAQSRVLAIGVATPDNPPIITLGTADSNSVLITAGLGCGGCHPLPVLDAAARTGATGAVQGNHATHGTTYAYQCNTCHIEGSQSVGGTYTSRHRRGTIELNTSGIGAVLNARYDKNSDHVADTVWNQTSTPALGRCENTACHGGVNSITSYGGPTGAGPTWGAAHTSTCTFCHNKAKTDTGLAADVYPTTASPFRSTAASAGAQDIHVRHLTSTLKTVVCADCHTSYATVGAAGHIDLATITAPADVPFPAGSGALFNTSSPSYATYVCTNVYCHGAKMPKGDDSGSARSPNWSTGNWTNFPTGCTAACHGLPPKTGLSTSISSHSSVTAGDLASCKTCHGDTVTSTTNPPTMSTVFHINGVLESTGCTGCHGTDPKQYPPLSKWGTNRSTANGVGAHVAHIESSATFMSKEAITGETDLTGYWCAECHTTTRGATGHDDAAYPADIAFTNAVEAKYNTHTPSITFEADNNPDLGSGATCSVYCHGAKMPKGDTSGTAKTPAWGVTLTGCGVCHGFPPTAGTSAGTHTGKTYLDCITCHPDTIANTNNPPTLIPAFHINGVLEAKGCSGCHGGDNATLSNKNYWPSGAGIAWPKRPGEHDIHMTRIALKLYGETLAQIVTDTGTTSDVKQKAICLYCHTAGGATPGATGHDTDNAPTSQADVGSFKRIMNGAVDGGTAGTYTSPNCFTVDCHNEVATNANGTFGWYSAATSSCVMCHTTGGTNGPNSGLHTTTTPTVTGKKHDNTLNGVTTNCLPCHNIPAYSAAGSHINGTFTSNGTADANLTIMGLPTTAGNRYTSTGTDNFGSCLGSWVGAAGCHDGAGDAGTWARKWDSTVSNATTGAECNGCHGGPDGAGWVTGVLNHDTNWNSPSDAVADEIIGNHGGNTDQTDRCRACHVYKDIVNNTYTTNAGGKIGWVGNTSNNSTYHGNGTLEFNINRSYSDTTFTCASSCHTAAGSHAMADSGWTVATVTGSPDLACTDCHTGGGTGALKVGSTSSHVDPDGTGTLAFATTGCAYCHFTSHTARTTNTVGVTWDARTMGTNYTADSKIYLKSNINGSAAVATEAEICWGCHWGAMGFTQPTLVKEFGSTQGAYTTGTLSQRNWVGATWTSANFAYKTAAVASIHQAMGATTVDPTIITTAPAAAQVATIGCTSCHDVHKVGNNGFAPTAAPYLRGSWTSNPFKEDGGPQTGQTWVAGDARGVVPRAAALLGVSGNNEYGGWQIEQNNASFTNTAYTGATGFGGLCANCHTQTKLEGMTWKGHDNAVSGFTAGSETNIFWQGNRMNWASAKKGTWEYGYIVNAGTTDARGVAAGKPTYIGALRNANQWGDGITPAAGKPQYTPLKQPSFTTGPVTTLDVTGTTAQANFHNFPCSKCHSPHASRLPRLMITNCLDAKHNLWDGDGTTHTHNPSAWAAVTPRQVAKELAYASTAGNCHRYVGSTDTNADDGVEAGWNSVTPW